MMQIQIISGASILIMRPLITDVILAILRSLVTKKDKSTYYLKLFLEYNFISVDNFLNYNATTIRDSLFNSKTILSQYLVCHDVRYGAYAYLSKYIKTQEFKALSKNTV